MIVFGSVWSCDIFIKKLDWKIAITLHEFAESGMNIEKAAGAKDVAILWQAICEVLYVASLKMAQMTGAN